MRQTLILSLLFLFPFHSNTATCAPIRPEGRDIVEKNFNTPIRVLLEKGLTAAQLTPLGGNLYVRTDKAKPWVSVGNKASIQLSNVSAKNAFFVVNGLSVRSPQFFLRASRLSTPIRFQAELYRGILQFSIGDKGMWVVDSLPLDDYLMGTLNAEMSASWEMEALKAQAVASRSYAVFRLLHPKSALYDIENTIQDQVYSGVSEASQRIRTAVLSTSGQILRFKSQPVKAYYHSRCGGSTEAAEAVWNGSAHSRKGAVQCPFCQHKPLPWKASFDFKEILHALKLDRFLSLPFQIAAFQKSPTGRLSWLKLGPRGQEKTVTVDELRSRLGYTRLKSALFNWKLSAHGVDFEGVGSGHGVGMCQWGARYLAQLGKDYRQILSFYYPNYSLR